MKNRADTEEMKIERIGTVFAERELDGERRKKRKRRKITKRRETNEGKDLEGLEGKAIQHCLWSCNFSSGLGLGSWAFSAPWKWFCRVANERQHATAFPWILHCWNLGRAFPAGWHPLDGGSFLASRACQLANLFRRRNVFPVLSKTVGRSRIHRLEASSRLCIRT